MAVKMAKLRNLLENELTIPYSYYHLAMYSHRGYLKRAGSEDELHLASTPLSIQGVGYKES